MSYRLPLLGPPFPAQQRALNRLWTPSGGIRKVLIQCGLGWGKTLLALYVAFLLLASKFRTDTLFLEPDTNRLALVFWKNWKTYIPAEYYSIKKLPGTTRQYIEWKATGNCLYPHIRDVHGSAESVADAFRGIEFTNVIDDETAIKFNKDQYINTFNRIRAKSDIRFYLCVTTPKMGPYASLLRMKDIEIFYGHSEDNVYKMAEFPGYIEEMKKNMSDALIRRELYGEMVALEGAVWGCFDRENSWPAGNMDDFRWDRNKPYILAGDIGVQSSWFIVQVAHGREVIVGEYHPNEGGTKQDVDFILRKYRQPAKVIVGGDLNTRSQVSGVSSMVEIREALTRHRMSQVQILHPDGIATDKGVQYNCLENLISRRALTYSRQCEFDGDKEKNRGFLALMMQDTWPKPGSPDMFNKDKRNGTGIEDARDAALYFAAVHHPLTVHGVR